MYFKEIVSGLGFEKPIGLGLTSPQSDMMTQIERAWVLLQDFESHVTKTVQDKLKDLKENFREKIFSEK